MFQVIETMDTRDSAVDKVKGEFMVLKNPGTTGVPSAFLDFRIRVFGLWFVSVLLMLASASVSATPDAELDATIQHLIAFVRQSDVRFERNFSSHDPLEAAQHIENKYRHFRDDIDTPEKFIELCATRSLVTGRAYRVVFSDGQALPAGEWLNHELVRYRTGSGQP